MNHHTSAARPASSDKRAQHFDRTARGLHADALDKVSPQVRVRLQQARRAASLDAPVKRSHPLWAWAGSTAVLALALGVGLQFQHPPLESAGAPFATAPASAADMSMAVFDDGDAQVSDLLAALDENPDFYLWLAANDGALSHPAERYP